MPLDEFRIEFDNPTRSYFQGQNVSGRVFVSNSTDKSTQGLKLKFEGTVIVHWSEEVTQTTGTGDDRQSRKVSKYYDDSDSLFEFKVYALGDGRTDTKIPAGRNMYPFNFTLPSMNLPSSYVGEYGQVTYQVEATIKRSWKFDQVIKEKFTVNSIVDLNQDRNATQPVERSSSKNFCCLCCTSGPVGFTIKLARTGFVCGEYVSCIVDLLNQSNRGINGASVALIQTATFHAQGSQKQSLKTVAEVKGPGVDPGGSEAWKPLLQVPAVPPTKLGGCRILDVQYTLKFELHVSGLAFNLKESIPVTIATIPFQSTFSQFSSVTPQNQPVGIPGGNFGLMNNGMTAPSAPSLYPEMPLPTYQGSFNFGPTPQQPTTIGATVAGAVIDKVVPQEENFVPQYPTYGWALKP